MALKRDTVESISGDTIIYFTLLNSASMFFRYSYKAITNKRQFLVRFICFVAYEFIRS